MSATQYPTFRSVKIIVPLTTALFGALGLSTGLYALLSPGPEPAKLFGITPPTRLDTRSEEDGRQRAYIQVHGIRNAASALGLLGVLSFWRFSSTCRSSAVATDAVQKAFAVLMATGCVVGVADGLIVARYAKSEGIGEEARTRAEEKKHGHVGIMVPVAALAWGWWTL